MSKETLTHLNTNTLIGFTEKRGHAWHYRAEEQGAESNHYPMAVPVEDVKRRLFHWSALSRPSLTTVPVTDLDEATGIDVDGTPIKVITVPGEQRIVRSDTHDVFGHFKAGYEIHQYEEWLLGTVATILDDDLSIGSAGLLKKGAVAWVSVEVPEAIETPEGVVFRPNLLAATSHDGSLSTTFQRVVTNVVCDNTMSAALGEKDQRIKVKHSRYSHLRIAQARDALAMIHTVSEDFAAEVKALTEVTVTPKVWQGFLDAFAPIAAEEGRSRTMASNKQDTLKRLWNHDERVAPWAGTAWGVVQAVNTFTHHEGIVRGSERAERNMLRAVTGGADKLDGDTLTVLNKVLANA